MLVNGACQVGISSIIVVSLFKKDPFARGSGGVCNYLLDYGHLQVYLWMIISFKQFINVQFHLFVSLLSLPCYIVLLGHNNSLHYFSPVPDSGFQRVFGGV